MKNAVVMLMASAFLLPACVLDSNRSVEAYCELLDTEVEALHAKYDEMFRAGESDPFAGLFIGLMAIAQLNGDLAVLAERLAEVAPEEVRLEHEAVATSMRTNADNTAKYANDPMGGLVAALVGGAVDNGSFRTVDEFSWSNCGQQLYGSV